MAVVAWGDEQFELLPEKAVWWPRRSTLLVADLHLGKAATFRSAGVPVPECVTDADLARLSLVLERTGAKRLVILGDLLHARTGRCPETFARVERWRSRHQALDVLLIRGNHDDRAGDPPAEWRFRVVDEPSFDESGDPADARIGFAHHPEAAIVHAHEQDRRIFCGHIHPAVRLEGGLRSMRAPCFWFGASVCVVPAFGGFTGCAVVRPAEGDRVFAVGPDQVVAVRSAVRERSVPQSAAITRPRAPGTASRPR